jgi:hypothetical protein
MTTVIRTVSNFLKRAETRQKETERNAQRGFSTMSDLRRLAESLFEWHTHTYIHIYIWLTVPDALKSRHHRREVALKEPEEPPTEAEEES